MPRGGKWCDFCGKTVPESHDVNHEADRTEAESWTVWIPDVVVVGSGPWDFGNHSGDGPGSNPRFIGWMGATGM